MTFRINKAVGRIMEGLYRCGWNKFVKIWCQSCDICAFKNKVNRMAGAHCSSLLQETEIKE